VSDPRDWGAGGTPPPAAPVPPRPLPPHLDPRRRSGPPRLPSQHVVPKGPTRRRPRRAARVLSWIAVVTSIAVLATAGAGYALINHYEGNIQRIKGVLGGKGTPAAAPHNAENFLIVGSDSRGDLKAGQGVQGTGATFVTGQRSDTVILAHVYGGKSNKVQLVSFPRDSVVEIPAYTDAKGTVHPAQQNRINYAFNEGGPQLLVQTVQHLTQIRIDHYLQVDFQGFQSMVDKLGGVDVCLPTAAHDHYSGINLSAGKHHINGTVALAFVRQRHGLTNGDIDRIKRQQQFIGAMIRKVLSAGTLANPFKLNGFLNVATSSLQADQGLKFSTLRTLALRMHNIGAGNVIFATIPLANTNAYIPRLGDVVLVDQQKADALFEQIRRDIPPGTPAPKPTTTAAANAPLIVRPGAIRVHVYNGSGVNGLGRKAAGDLSNVGFQVVGQPETRGSGATTTVVRYGPTKADSARTLAAAIPGSHLEAAPDLSNVLEVVVGSGYTGAKLVKVTASAASAEPNASPTPKVVTALDDPCAA
jgi:LCP family protein required for cell wall assembly